MRYTAGLLFGILSTLLLFLLPFITSPWLLFFVVVLWAGVLGFTEWKIARKMQPVYAVVPLIVINFFSIVCLFGLAEVGIVRWFVAVLGGVLTGLLCGLPVGFFDVAHEHKRLRRVFSMIWVIDLYALLTTLYAFDLFFPIVSFWLLAATGSVLSGGIAYAVWRLYVDISSRKFLFWSVVVAIATGELMWAFHLLPFGYFVSGFITTWLWYVGIILVRFNFGDQGIIWRRQRHFLLVGLCLLLLVLIFFVRWV